MRPGEKEILITNIEVPGRREGVLMRAYTVGEIDALHEYVRDYEISYPNHWNSNSQEATFLANEQRVLVRVRFYMEAGFVAADLLNARPHVKKLEEC